MGRPKSTKPESTTKQKYVTTERKAKHKRLETYKTRGLSPDQVDHYETIMVLFEYHWGFNEESYDKFINNEYFPAHIKLSAENLKNSYGVDTAIRYLAHNKAASMVRGDSLNSKVEQKGVVCPDCNSDNIGKDGRYKRKQRYLCKTCGRRFVGVHTHSSAPAKK